MSHEAEGPLSDENYYRLALTVRETENDFLEHTYRSATRRLRSRSPYSRWQNAGWILYDGLQASVAKKNLNSLAQDHNLIIGGENNSYQAGNTSVFDDDRMHYFFSDHLDTPEENEEVSFMNSEVALTTDSGPEVILFATCIRSTEIKYLGLSFEEFQDMRDEEVRREHRTIRFHESVDR